MCFSGLSCGVFALRVVSLSWNVPTLARLVFDYSDEQIVTWFVRLVRLCLFLRLPLCGVIRSVCRLVCRVVCLRCVLSLSRGTCQPLRLRSLRLVFDYIPIS